MSQMRKLMTTAEGPHTGVFFFVFHGLPEPKYPCVGGYYSTHGCGGFLWEIFTE